MTVHFNIFYLHVNTVASSAAMAVGTNILTGFGSSTKTVKGNGQINGYHGSMPVLRTSIHDREQVDTPDREVGRFGYILAGDTDTHPGQGK